jgi:hypothetical protein
VTAAAGYSGTPLARKLGYRDGSVAFVSGAPPEYLAWLQPLPVGVVFGSRLGTNVDLVHVFAVDRAALADFLATSRPVIRPDASLWVSWPKKASRVPTTITEDTIREMALPLGLVDVKVCAVSAVWSGLKLVLRRALR